MKEKLISLSSGKRLRKSNSYRLNFRIIAKKSRTSKEGIVPVTVTVTQQQQGTENDLIEKSLGSNSEFVNGQNAPTNTIIQYIDSKNKGTQSSSSSNNQVVAVDDDDKNKKTRLPLLNYTPQKTQPCGYKYAHKIVLKWADSKKWYHAEGAESRWASSFVAFAEYLAFFNAPSIDDVQWTFDKINNQNDWDTLEDTTNYIRRQIDAGRKIHNLNGYCRKAFETNIENAYVETEAEEE